MARKLASDLRDVEIPAPVLDRLEREPRGGVELACDLVDEIRGLGSFDGVHLIPVGRYRETAGVARVPRPPRELWSRYASAGIGTV